jgi:hypothetical protein
VRLTSLERQERTIFLKNNTHFDEERGCELWKLGKFKNGYGWCWFQGKNIKVHRLAYAVFKGDFDDKWHVLHKCDVRHCINPEHLFLGTNVDNIADRNVKGRQAKGEKNGRFKKGHLFVGEKSPHVKLCEQQVIEILAKWKIGLSGQLAKEYNVSRGAIQGIVKRRNWKHVEKNLPLVFRSNRGHRMPAL